MAEKSYKPSKRGKTLGKKVGMENLTLMTIFVSICFHIHVFDYMHVFGFRKIHGPV